MDAVQLAAPAAVRPAAPPIDEVKRRKSRITAYSQSMQQWMTDVCRLSPGQQQQLKVIANAEIGKSQQAFQERDAQKANQPLLDTFPVKFTLRYGIAEELDLTRHHRKLKDVLTAEQQEKLKAAADERRKFHIDAMIGRVLNMLDKELYLTLDQRQKMAEPLKRRLNGMESSSFSLYAQSYYYKQTSIAFLLQRGDHLNFLNDVQMARAKDFTGLAQKWKFLQQRTVHLLPVQ